MRAALGLASRDGEPPSWPPVRHPHQLFLMYASVLSGGVGIVGIGRPRTVEQALHPTLTVLWLATVFLCGLCGLTAAVLVRRHIALSLLLERIALMTIAPSAFVYSVIVVSATGWSGFYTACMIGGYGAACVARALQVNETVRWLHKLAEIRQEDV